jgi:SagB-type dehydrogenase family enzyme
VSGRAAALRRAPHLVSYWIGDRLIFHNYATGAVASADPLVCTVLHFFDRWRSAEQLARRFPDYRLAALRAAVAALERQSLLIRRGSRVERASARLDAWGAWNPAAGFFHLSTKDMPYSRDHEKSSRELVRKAKSEPMPAPTKRYAAAPQFPLPPVNAEGQFVDVLRSRRTWRTFSRRPITGEQLGMLLGLTFGVQGWVKLPGIGRTPLKTAPSGGARHPIEAYVLVRRVTGLKPGLYHYSADRHLLERLNSGPAAPPITRYLPTQPWFNAAGALVLMTAVFPRVQWRYHFARAYRVVLADAGHVCQTFCLTATWLGLAPFCSMALADSRIEQDLGIDGVNESVLYAAGIGTRPRGRRR